MARTAYKPGDLIGDDYEVRDILGAGGFGIVYLVYQRRTKSVYALKTFREELLSDPQAPERFRKEARIWIELERHPNIVRAYQVSEFEGRLFIALEYIAPNEDGLNSLDGFLLTGQISLRQGLNWAIQFCDGMIHANAKGIRCHRDIKPANIMITRNSILKISDMGLAGALASKSPTSASVVTQWSGGPRLSLSMRGAARTPTHMPPEQFVEAALCDVRSDIYSFGVVLFQICNQGQLPFLAVLPRNQSEPEMMRFWAEMQLLHERARVPKMDTRWQGIVHRCLEKDPDRRYQDFERLREDLVRILKHEYHETVTELPVADLEAWEICNKGAALYSLDDTAQALFCFDEALRLAPHLAATWNNKGLCLKSLGRFQEALGCFDRAIGVDQHSAEAWSNKATCLDQLRRHGEAMECHDRALVLDAKSAGSWLNKGNSLLTLERIAEAYNCFATALQLNPRYAAAWFRQGLCCQAFGRFDEAIRCFDEAIRLHPADAGAWCSKALSLSSLGKNDEALAVLSEGDSITRLPAFALFIKAGVEERLDKIDDAVKSYRQFITKADESEVEQVAFAKHELERLVQKDSEAIRSAKARLSAAVVNHLAVNRISRH